MGKEKDKDMRQKIAKKLKNAVKPHKKEQVHHAFEERADLQKLYMYVIVVEQDVTNTVIKLLQNAGSSAQFIHNGRGTAPSEIVKLLNANIDKKAVINAFVSEDKLQDIEEELTLFFHESRKNRGVGFAIPFSSIQGIRMYKYLTQTI